MAQKEFRQIYPKETWVEHDPMEIYSSQMGVMTEIIAKSGISVSDIAAIGITNQRETAVVWDKATGKPVYNAIVWQCRRTAGAVDRLKADGYGEYIRDVTGLVPDAYFSGTKISWILDNADGARKRAENGELLFGTVDTWLIWKLTDGKVHVTDYTNASRTMLYDIHKLKWDGELLRAMNVPENMLPEVKNSSEVYGYAKIQGEEIPIAGIAGDQQAALFGQACFEKGEIKNTYGTGCFMLLNTGKTPAQSKNGLITTIASGINGEVAYALEGSVFAGGSVIQWLRDGMRFFAESSDAEYYASKVSDTGGVYFVPAFTGLGAPYWDMNAGGMIMGITRGTKREHIIRAAQESIAYQCMDVINAMRQDADGEIKALYADGGASRDGFLMQFQADVADIKIVRPAMRETTALGAAYLAGLAVGIWESVEQIKKLPKDTTEFVPSMPEKERYARAEEWHRAVSRSLGWRGR